jgi:hypothetical protein
LTKIVHCTYIFGRAAAAQAQETSPHLCGSHEGRTMFTNIEDFQKYNKEQMDAASAAMATFTKGFQQMAAEATDYSKKSIETGSATFEKLLAAKTLDNAFQIQSDYAKSSYEGFVSQATRFGELYANLAKDAFRPMESAFAKMQPLNR